MAPRVFVSYDRKAGAPLSTWVRTFVDELRAHGGADARVDLFDPEAQAGRDLPTYLEDNLQAADAVLLVCTPGYKEQLDQRTGAPGFEASILSGEKLQGDRRPVIAVIRDGDPKTVAPPWVPEPHIDLRGNVSSRAAWEALLDALHLERLPTPADVGDVPVRSSTSDADGFRVAPEPRSRPWIRWTVGGVLAIGLLFILQIVIFSPKAHAPPPRTQTASSEPKVPTPKPVSPTASPATESEQPAKSRAELDVHGGTGVGGALTGQVDQLRVNVKGGGTGVKGSADVKSSDVNINVKEPGSTGIEGDLNLDGSR